MHYTAFAPGIITLAPPRGVENKIAPMWRNLDRVCISRRLVLSSRSLFLFLSLTLPPPTFSLTCFPSLLHFLHLHSLHTLLIFISFLYSLLPSYFLSAILFPLYFLSFFFSFFLLSPLFPSLPSFLLSISPSFLHLLASSPFPSSFYVFPPPFPLFFFSYFLPFFISSFLLFLLCFPPLRPSPSFINKVPPLKRTGMHPKTLDVVFSRFFFPSLPFPP